MSRTLLAFATLACACNSAPKNTCTPYAHSIAAGGAAPSTCDGVCTPVSYADAAYELCTVDCTDGGNAACPEGTTCTSAEPISSSSYCLITCDADAGDAGVCPSPLICSSSGVCIP